MIVHPSNHPDPEVEQALVRLNDTLCQWERATGRTSALILIEQGDFKMRCLNGIPSHIDDINDTSFLEIGQGTPATANAFPSDPAVHPD